MGTIPNWYDHVRVVCSTAGLTEWFLPPSAASNYYLVAPRNNDREGSWGLSSVAERPQAIGSCYGQSIAACP